MFTEPWQIIDGMKTSLNNISHQMEPHITQFVKPDHVPTWFMFRIKLTFLFDYVIVYFLWLQIYMHLPQYIKKILFEKQA
jgi:hypothetical protein